MASAGYLRAKPSQFDFHCPLPCPHPWTLFLRSRVTVSPGITQREAQQPPASSPSRVVALSWPCSREQTHSRELPDLEGEGAT